MRQRYELTSQVARELFLQGDGRPTNLPERDLWQANAMLDKLLATRAGPPDQGPG